MPTTFIASNAAFAKALAQITPAISSRPLVPAVECVLLKCTGSVVGQGATLWLIGTNLETTLAVKLAVECQENFSLLVPAKKLLETLRALPDQPVTFTANETTFTLEIKAERSKYKLTGFSVSDMPKVPALKRDQTTLTLPGNILRAGLLSALVAARKDNLDSELEYILIEVDPKALDGHVVNIVGANNPIITVYSHPMEGTLDIASKQQWMISRDAAQHLASILSPKDDTDVTLLADSMNIRLKDGRWTSRLMEGTYPQYERLIPTNNQQLLFVDASELLAAVKRLNGYTEGDHNNIALHLASPTTATLTAQNTALEQAGLEELLVEYQGGPMDISFNSQLLASLLALHAGKRVTIALSDETRPALIYEEQDDHDYHELLYLLSPVRNLVAA